LVEEVLRREEHREPPSERVGGEEEGQVLLSLHYQHGWRARPGWVQVEREPDPFDPIPFLRLRLSGPVARVTLTWDGR